MATAVQYIPQLGSTYSNIQHAIQGQYSRTGKPMACIFNNPDGDGLLRVECGPSGLESSAYTAGSDQERDMDDDVRKLAVVGLPEHSERLEPVMGKDAPVPQPLTSGGSPGAPMKIERVTTLSMRNGSYFDIAVVAKLLTKPLGGSAGSHQYFEANYSSKVLGESNMLTGVLHSGDPPSGSQTLVHSITFDNRDSYVSNREKGGASLDFVVSGWQNKKMRHFGSAAAYILGELENGEKVLYVYYMYNLAKDVGDSTMAHVLRFTPTGKRGYYQVYAMPQIDDFMRKNESIPGILPDTLQMYSMLAVSYVEEKKRVQLEAESTQPVAMMEPDPSEDDDVPDESSTTTVIRTSSDTPYMVVAIGNQSLPEGTHHADAPVIYIKGSCMSDSVSGLADMVDEGPPNPACLMALTGRSHCIETRRELVTPKSNFKLVHDGPVPPLVVYTYASDWKDSTRYWMEQHVRFNGLLVVRPDADGERAAAAMQPSDLIGSLPLNLLGCLGPQSLCVVQACRSMYGVATAGFGPYFFEQGELVTEQIDGLLRGGEAWRGRGGASGLSIGPGLPPAAPDGFESIEAALESLPLEPDAYFEAGSNEIHKPTHHAFHRVLRMAMRASAQQAADTRLAATALAVKVSNRLSVEIRGRLKELTRARGGRSVGIEAEACYKQVEKDVSVAVTRYKAFNRLFLAPSQGLQLEQAGRARQQVRRDAMAEHAKVADEASQSPEKMAAYLAGLEDSADGAGGAPTEHTGIVVSIDLSGNRPSARSRFLRHERPYEQYPYFPLTLGALLCAAPHPELPLLFKEEENHSRYYSDDDDDDDDDESHIYQLGLFFAPATLRATGQPFSAVDAYKGEGSQELTVLRRALRQICAGSDGSASKETAWRALHLICDVLDLLRSTCPGEGEGDEDALPTCPHDTLVCFRRALFRLAMSICGAGENPLSKLWHYTATEDRSPLRGRRGQSAFCEEEWALLSRLHAHRTLCDQRDENGTKPIPGCRALEFVVGRMNRLAQDGYISRHEKTTSSPTEQAQIKHANWLEATKRPAEIWLARKALAGDAGCAWLDERDSRLEAHEALVPAWKRSSPRYTFVDSNRIPRWEGALEGEGRHQELRCDRSQCRIAELPKGERMDLRRLFLLKAYSRLRKALRRALNNNSGGQRSKALLPRAEAEWPLLLAFQSKATAPEALPTLSSMADDAFQLELLAFASELSRDEKAALLKWNVWDGQNAANARMDGSTDNAEGAEGVEPAEAIPMHEQVAAMAARANSPLYGPHGAVPDFDVRICHELNLPKRVAAELLRSARVESLAALMERIHSQYRPHGPQHERAMRTMEELESY